MTFRIVALSPDSFAPLFARSDEELAALGAARQIVGEAGTTPCRVSLVDAAPGEEVVLVPFTHLDAPSSPYRGGGAIFVRRGAVRAEPAPGEVPEQLRRRLLSVRAYDAAGWMKHADVTPGAELAAVIGRLFADPAVAYLHVHNAKPGCYAARVDRA